ncbi:MAG: coenzyme F420-0:L-glutamate ligase [Chloroflexi bacterium]|nr:coenzyme F420-0:L-glutamate ligase [Chloroflexota bacterium]
MSSLVITQLQNIPLIHEGDQLSEILYQALIDQGITLENRDILGVTSKIVSKTEGRWIKLSTVNPSKRALELSKQVDRDARLVELILSESISVIRATKQALIVEHKLGFICANAGIDHSNVKKELEGEDDWYLLLPKNPDESAKNISSDLKKYSDRQVGVIIIDSHGRPWRKGTVGVVIGTSLVPALVDLRGIEDIFGYKLRITIVAAADELAAAASLMMGQAAERVPAVHIRGFPYTFTDTSINDVLRPAETDLFR